MIFCDALADFQTLKLSNFLCKNFIKIVVKFDYEKFRAPARFEGYLFEDVGFFTHNRQI